MKKMKVLIGFFTTESNANISDKCNLKQYDIAFEEECVNKNNVKEVFEKYNIETIGAVYANAAGAGVVEFEAFNYIEKCFIESVKKYLHEIDGIYLHLHGASYVENIGSGDFHILKSIRAIVGPYFPIAVVCDPHGNLCKEYVESCTLIRSYRESPHTDADETKKKVAEMLCHIIKERRNIHAIYRKLPLILGGEQSVSTDEPVYSINRFMDEMERDPRILSASWHVGYLRHDCPEAGCGIVVVPQSSEDQEYCEQKADELAQYVWNKRHEFHYTGYTTTPDKAIKEAYAFDGKPVFITDSGDNTTSGASGFNTFILRQVLEVEMNKKVLFANITDKITEKYLESKEVGSQCHIELGMDVDEMSKKVPLDVEIISKEEMRGNMWSGRDKKWGEITTVKVVGKQIYIAISTCNNSMTEKGQFDHANLNWDEFDIIVVKQGYLFPELKKKAAFSIMSLTNGATPQDTRIIPFKLIMRPMFPIDKI